LEVTKSVIASTQIFKRQDTRAEKGQRAYENTYFYPPVVIPWIPTDNEPEGSLSTINHEFVKSCIDLINRVNNVVLDTKLVPNLAITDKANTKAFRELMADLNRCTTSSYIPDKDGDDATVTYRVGKTTVSTRVSSIMDLIRVQGLNRSMGEISSTNFNLTLNPYPSRTPWSDPVFKIEDEPDSYPFKDLEAEHELYEYDYTYTYRYNNTDTGPSFLPKCLDEKNKHQKPSSVS